MARSGTQSLPYLAPSLCFTQRLPVHTLRKPPSLPEASRIPPLVSQSTLHILLYFPLSQYILFVCISVSTLPYPIPGCEFMDNGNHIPSLYLQPLGTL